LGGNAELGFDVSLRERPVREIFAPVGPRGGRGGRDLEVLSRRPPGEAGHLRFLAEIATDVAVERMAGDAGPLAARVEAQGVEAPGLLPFGAREAQRAPRD